MRGMPTQHDGGRTREDAAKAILMELYGVEMRQKRVSRGGRHQGRVYLPLSWLGKWIKIARVDWSLEGVGR